MARASSQRSRHRTLCGSRRCMWCRPTSCLPRCARSPPTWKSMPSRSACWRPARSSKPWPKGLRTTPACRSCSSGMIAASGDPLLDPDAVDALRSVLIPLATLITPNMPCRGRSAARLLACAQRIRDGHAGLAAGNCGRQGGAGQGRPRRGAEARSTSCSLALNLSGSSAPRRHPQYPWHRLHALRGYRRRARQGGRAA